MMEEFKEIERDSMIELYGEELVEFYERTENRECDESDEDEEEEDEEEW